MHRHANMTKLPMHHIDKILPILYISAIFAHKSRYPVLRYCSARNVQELKLPLRLLTDSCKFSVLLHIFSAKGTQPSDYIK